MVDDLKEQLGELAGRIDAARASNHFAGFYVREVGPGPDVYREVPELLKVDQALEDARDRIKQLEQERQWRPISTAPTDGTHVLVVVDWLPQPTILFWNQHPKMQCWENPSSGATDPRGNPWQPTHWMPLPVPPDKEEGK